MKKLTFIALPLLLCLSISSFAAFNQMSDQEIEKGVEACADFDVEVAREAMESNDRLFDGLVNGEVARAVNQGYFQYMTGMCQFVLALQDNDLKSCLKSKDVVEKGLKLAAKQSGELPRMVLYLESFSYIREFYQVARQVSPKQFGNRLHNTCYNKL